MALKQLKQIYALFMRLPKTSRSMTLAIAYLDSFKMNWNTEGMSRRSNDQAILFYDYMSERFYMDIRKQPSRKLKRKRRG